MKKIVKVPSMARFREYLLVLGACRESQVWLDSKDFKTVRAMYEYLAEKYADPQYRWEFRERYGGALCCPGTWLGWLFIPASTENTVPRIFLDGGAAPAWAEVREYLRQEVNYKVPLDPASSGTCEDQGGPQ